MTTTSAPAAPIRTADVVGVLVLTVLIVLGVLATARIYPDLLVGPLWLHLALGVAMTVPLAVRRRWPRTVLWVTTAAFGTYRALGGIESGISSLALFLAIYTVGAELPPRQSRWPRAIVVAVMALFVVYQVAESVPSAESLGGQPLAGMDRTVLAAFSLGLNIIFFVAAWVIGDLVWRSRKAERELAAHAEELAASRQALALRAVQDERVRIARELHDVVAHHVSVMGIQAGAARRAIERDPDRARSALAGVEQSSRDAVGELQQLLGFLRSNEDAALDGPAPQPKLGELDALVDAVRDVGLEVELVVDGARRPLPDSVELSAYRIIQEALTNTLRHADGASRAEVHVDYGHNRLRLTVRDDGTASSRVAAGSEGGRGLLGMRERASLHGGELATSARPGGGFEVDGWLPIREQPA